MSTILRTICKNERIVFVLSFVIACYAGSNLCAQGNEHVINKDSLKEQYKSSPDAEEDDNKQHRKGERWQQWSFDQGDYPFPARKKDKISIGLNFGVPIIAGDVQAIPGYGAGFHIRKSLGFLFSLRAFYHMGRSRGQNWVRSAGFRFNRGLNGTNDPNVNYRNQSYPYVYYNYQTDFTDFSLQGVISLNNVNFHKHEPRIGLYFFVGGGWQTYKTMINALDENGQMYDYSGVSTDPTKEARQLILDQLDQLMDDTYETPAEGHLDEETVFNSVINPHFVTGIGLTFKVSKLIELMVEEKVSFANDDLLDGQRWTESVTLTRGFDLMHYVNAGIGFRIGGKKAESAWWTNPMMIPRYDWFDKKKGERIEDADGDGVIDLMDEEPDTPFGAPVDTKGRTLDTDGDGVPDYLDQERLSRQGVEVDSVGVTLDDDNDNVPNGIDQEPQTPPGSIVDVYGRAVIIPQDTGRATTIIESSVISSELYLPVIHFDLGKDKIKRDFYPELFRVADLLNKRPEMDLWVIGHTDIRSDVFYNENLAYRRAKNVIDFLVKTFGVDEQRLHVDYVGERKTLIQDLPDNRDRKFEDLHYLNRRVEFRVYR